MTSQRIDNLRRLLKQRPDDPRLRFGLAMEYEKDGMWGAVVEHLQHYLEQTDDEGNAWGRLGHALSRLGRHEDARAAYRTGVDAALRHGHPSMAAEFQDVLDNWNDNEDL
jgi:predicted Zn-dependent protease